MNVISSPIDFPMHALPEIVKNAVFEIENITKAPLPMIASAILGSMSLACQSNIDVVRPGGLRGPTSLYIISIAESGERKSTIDKLILGPLYKYEQILLEQYKFECSSYDNKMVIFQAEKAAIVSKIKSDIKHGIDPSASKMDLEVLLENKPIKPIRHKIIVSDFTPASLKENLSGKLKSLGVISDEAGVVFNGKGLDELPLMNTMWDGSSFSVERKNRPDTHIIDSRLTILLQVQPRIFTSFINRKEEIAKGSGYLARCLICYPNSTQGYRQIRNSISSREHLHKFQIRFMEIIKNGIKREQRDALEFTPEAESYWINYYNETEMETGPNGDLRMHREFASKLSDQLARIAAVLHFFNNDPGGISLHATQAASLIINWYMVEHERIFSKVSTSVQIQNDASELFNWICSYCSQHSISMVRKNIILQYGPNKTRNKEKLNELLHLLAQQRKISIQQNLKTIYIKIPHQW